MCNIVILGSEQPEGVGIDDQGGEGLRDANYTKSYSTQKILGKPLKNRKTPKKPQKPPQKPRKSLKNLRNPPKD